MIISFTMFLTAALAAPPQLPKLLREIETKYKKAQTLSAEFTQVNEIAALQQKKTSSGTLQVKRPGKVRWEELRPMKNLLVSNGKKFWFYTPPFDEGERGQVIETSSQEAQSKLVNALLSGSFSAARDLKIEQKSPTEFVLTPTRKGAAGTVERARIQIALKAKLIEKVILENKGGNRSEVSLSKIELGKPIEDKRFEFTLPANTDRVTQ